MSRFVRRYTHFIHDLELKAFICRPEVLDRCAIKIQIIGNQIGNSIFICSLIMLWMLYATPEASLRTRMGERMFRKGTFFENIKAVLDYLEDGCRCVTGMVSGNRKKHYLFGRGISSLFTVSDKSFGVEWTSV